MNKFAGMIMALMLVACGNSAGSNGNLAGNFSNIEQGSNFSVKQVSQDEFNVDGVLLETEFTSIPFKRVSNEEINNILGKGAADYVVLIAPVDTSLPVAHGKVDLGKVGKGSDFLKQFEPYNDSWTGYFVFAGFGVIPIYEK